jgi:hypothetical protein
LGGNGVLNDIDQLIYDLVDDQRFGDVRAELLQLLRLDDLLLDEHMVDQAPEDQENDLNGQGKQDGDDDVGGYGREAGLNQVFNLGLTRKNSAMPEASA